jgi:hypothetical protein
MQTPKQIENERKEGCMLFAICALKTGSISSIGEAAKIYNVHRTTLTHRLRGRPARVNTRANYHKLTDLEEQTFVEWVLDMDSRSFPLRIMDYVRLRNYCFKNAILTARLDATGLLTL